MNQYPEALPPRPYPNRLPFMQDFAATPERPDAAEQHRVAGYFSDLVNTLYKERGRESDVYPANPGEGPLRWQVAVQAVGRNSGMRYVEKGIDLSAMDVFDDAGDTYQYQLGRDGVVRRFDTPIVVGTSQFESDSDFLQRVYEVDDANAANEDFAIEMGMDGQPVFLDELRALEAFIAENS